MNHHLIVGLGNPGSRFEKTRHNAGWIVLDSLIEEENLRWIQNEHSEHALWVRGGHTFHLLKPGEFMNLSGRETARLARFYKIPVDSILIVHDEIDLPFGKIQNKVGGGTAGHNGVGDIVEKLGDNRFHRIRFGIGKPKLPGVTVADYVLQDFSSEELSRIPDLLQECRNRIREWVAKRISGKP